MEQRERAVRLWFDMWLKKEDLGILDLFAKDAVYIESWGRRSENQALVRRMEHSGDRPLVGYSSIFSQGGPDRRPVAFPQPDERRPDGAL